MAKSGVWVATVTRKNARRTRPLYFVVLMVFISLAFGASRWGGEELGWLLYVCYGAAFLGLLYAVLSYSRGQTGTLSIGDGKLILLAGKERKELNLEGVRMAFGKHYAAKNYAYFSGTVCHLTSVYSKEKWRMLGAGVEFPEKHYREEATYGSDCEIGIATDAFHELLAAIKEISPEVSFTVPGAPAADGEQVSFDREQRFEAFPMRGGAMVPIMIWMGGIFGVTLVAALASTFVSDETIQSLGPYAAMAVIVPIFILVVYVSIRKSRRRGEMVLGRYSLQMLINGRPKREVRLPLSIVRPLYVEITGRGGTYYSGPAVEIRDQSKNKVRLLIGDTSKEWEEDAKKVTLTDFSIGLDAGRTLIGWLESSGYRTEPYVLGDRGTTSGWVKR